MRAAPFEERGPRARTTGRHRSTDIDGRFQRPDNDHPVHDVAWGQQSGRFQVRADMTGIYECAKRYRHERANRAQGTVPF